MNPDEAWVVFDVETFPNFWMVGVRDVWTGAVRQFSTEPGVVGDSLVAARQWYSDAANKALFLGFNSLGYDNILCRAVLIDGVDDPRVLYQLSQDTISAKRLRQDQIDTEVSIDLLAINGGMNSSIGSLKECGVKIDYGHLQELPYAYDHELQNHDEMRNVAAYNLHDLAITASIARRCRDAIEARLALGIEYRLRSLFNRHDAGLAVDVLGRLLFAGKPEWPNQRTWSTSGKRFTAGFRYRTPELQALRDRIANWRVDFHLEEVIKPGGDTEKRIVGEPYSDTVEIDGVGYRIGVGGLHTADEPGIWEANEQYRLIDFDVASFYPSLMINRGLTPSHLPKKQVVEALSDLRQKRLDAKRAGLLALSAGLKIAINAAYGKLKSPYSWLCDPLASLGVALTGQLTLLSFVDLVAGIEGITVVSGNTDGLLLRIQRDIAEQVIGAMHALAGQHNLSLDQVEYRMVARADVSNFIAVPFDPNEPIKARGAYRTDPSALGKKATNRIVVAAAQAYFAHGTPVGDTIRAGTDIRDFVDYFKATKGYRIVDDQGADHGTIARWYLARAGRHLDKIKIMDGKTIQIVDRGACVIANLPDAMPDDVDFDAYIAKADALVKRITEPEIKMSNTIPLAELNRQQADQQRRNLEITTPDLNRCQEVDLKAVQTDYVSLTKGNAYDTMKALAVRLWLSERGALSRGDLLWLCQQIDEPVGKFSGTNARTLRAMTDWVSREISPFPIPRTTAEHVARARPWALEHVAPLKRKRAVLHSNVLSSDFISGETLRKFAKKGDEYVLACSICAVGVKHDRLPADDVIIAIIQEVKDYFSEQQGITNVAISGTAIPIPG